MSSFIFGVGEDRGALNLWHLEPSSYVCGVRAAPFPSGNGAAYFGRGDNLLSAPCDYNLGSIIAAGSLTLVSAVELPKGSWVKTIVLSFSSYEIVEAGIGSANRDIREVELVSSRTGALLWSNRLSSPSGQWTVRSSLACRCISMRESCTLKKEKCCHCRTSKSLRNTRFT